MTGPLQSYSSQSGHILTRPQVQEAADGRFDKVDRIGAAVGLGQDILDAAGFEHITNAWPRLDACAGSSGHENDPAAAEAADDAMGNGLALELNLLLPSHQPLSVFDG